MKYLSLVKFMSLYGKWMKRTNQIVILPHNEIERTIGVDVDFRPFQSIQKEAIFLGNEENANGEDAQPDQVINHIFRNDVIHFNYYGAEVPELFELPPVLEMEWLREKLDFTAEVMDVLEQLSYYVVANILSYVMSHARSIGTNDYEDHLEEEEVIIDVEDIEDTPAILMNEEFVDPKYPKIRNYNVGLFYDNDVVGIITQCLQQHNVFKHLYLHSPILLSMFMVDYFGNELREWGKTSRILLKEKLDGLLDDYRFRVAASDYGNLYTYGRSSIETNKDRELYCMVLEEIKAKLQKVNRNMGLISVWAYRKISGPDRTNASVRLSEMGINWDTEMQRVEEEKKEKEEVAYD